MPMNQNTEKDADIPQLQRQLELFHLIFDNIYNGAISSLRSNGTRRNR